MQQLSRDSKFESSCLNIAGVATQSRRHLFFRWRFPSQSRTPVKSNHLFVPSLPQQQRIARIIQLGFQTVIKESTLAKRQHTCPPGPGSRSLLLNLKSGEFIMMKHLKYFLLVFCLFLFLLPLVDSSSADGCLLWVKWEMMFLRFRGHENAPTRDVSDSN